MKNLLSLVTERRYWDSWREEESWLILLQHSSILSLCSWISLSFCTKSNLRMRFSSMNSLLFSFLSEVLVRSRSFSSRISFFNWSSLIISSYFSLFRYSCWRFSCCLVSWICMHYMCCGCEVNYKIECWLQKANCYIESKLSVPRWSKHTGRCVRSRPIRGVTRSVIWEKIQFCFPATLRDKLYGGLSTEQRALGSFVEDAHPDVYRKIKSERQDYNKFKN